MANPATTAEGLRRRLAVIEGELPGTSIVRRIARDAIAHAERLETANAVYRAALEKAMLAFHITHHHELTIPPIAECKAPLCKESYATLAVAKAPR